jgi:hypothetical protein
VAQIFARSFDAESSAIFQLNLAQGSAALLGITGNFDAKAMSEYEAYYHQKDLWAIEMSKSPTGRARLGHEIVGEAEFLNSEVYNGFAKRIEMFWSVASRTCRGRCCFNADSKVLRRTIGLSSTHWKNSRSA